MPRVILFTGKGGVGKTTMAAATAMVAAHRGARTLLMSFDLAHSLSDAFDLNRRLFNLNRGLPRTVMPGLDMQEIDVQEELERHWGEIAQYTMVLMSTTGLSEVVAEEMAIFPGMEDVVALLYLNQYVRDGSYDTIILDCPPTGESLRFVSITATLRWYMRKRFRFDRNVIRFAGPLASKIADFDLPDDSYFAAIERLFDRINGVEQLLLDPRQTTVRLVTNAEKMVVRETQRAYMYFSMYGMTTDAVIINRLLSSVDGPFAGWAKTHSKQTARIREYFEPVPVFTLPLFPDEVVGERRLEEVANELYGDEDPNQFFLRAPPYTLKKEGERYVLRLRLPFVSKRELDVSREDHDLVVRVGTFKRFVPLPRHVARLPEISATMVDDSLVVEFHREGSHESIEKA